MDGPFLILLLPDAFQRASRAAAADRGAPLLGGLASSIRRPLYWDTRSLFARRWLAEGVEL